jgi:hypothetical protein
MSRRVRVPLKGLFFSFFPINSRNRTGRISRFVAERVAGRDTAYLTKRGGVEIEFDSQFGVLYCLDYFRKGKKRICGINVQF